MLPPDPMMPEGCHFFVDLFEPPSETLPFGWVLGTAEDPHGAQPERAGIDLAPAGVDDDLGAAAAHIDIEVGLCRVECLAQPPGREDRAGLGLAADDLDRDPAAVADQRDDLAAVFGLAHGARGVGAVVLDREGAEERRKTLHGIAQRFGLAVADASAQKNVVAQPDGYPDKGGLLVFGASVLVGFDVVDQKTDRVRADIDGSESLPVHLSFSFFSFSLCSL